MKPEYWKDKNAEYYYKSLRRTGAYTRMLEISSVSIVLGDYPESWLLADSKPCTEAAFMKWYNQTLKKIERAVGK